MCVGLGEKPNSKSACNFPFASCVDIYKPTRNLNRIAALHGCSRRLRSCLVGLFLCSVELSMASSSGSAPVGADAVDAPPPAATVAVTVERRPAAARLSELGVRSWPK